MKHIKARKREMEYSIANLNDLQIDNRIMAVLQYRLDRGEKLADEEAQTLIQAQWAIDRLGMVISILMTPGKWRQFFLDNPDARESIVEDLIRVAAKYRPNADRVSVRQSFEAIRDTEPDTIVN